MELTLLYPRFAFLTEPDGKLLFRPCQEKSGEPETPPFVLGRDSESLFPKFPEFMDQLIGFACLSNGGPVMKGSPSHTDSDIWGGPRLGFTPTLQRFFLGRLALTWNGCPVIDWGALIYPTKAVDALTLGFQLTEPTSLVDALQQFVRDACQGLSESESVQVYFGTRASLTAFREKRQKSAFGDYSYSDELAETLLSLGIRWEELKDYLPSVASRLSGLVEGYDQGLAELRDRRAAARQEYRAIFAAIRASEARLRLRQQALSVWQEQNPLFQLKG